MYAKGKNARMFAKEKNAKKIKESILFLTLYLRNQKWKEIRSINQEARITMPLY